MDHGADFSASAAALDGLTTAAQSRAFLLPSSLVHTNEKQMPTHPLSIFMLSRTIQRHIHGFPKS